ncbi:MAG: phosphoglycerol geranylgeranyltransferase [Flavobacteriales bacterium]|jgi:phosphoglycerol geranylgeranyltransferase
MLLCSVKVLEHIQSMVTEGKKGLAVLLDPDKLVSKASRDRLINLINSSPVDLVLVGGSLIVEDHFDEVTRAIKSSCKKPLILFPGSATQVTKNVDAVLFLSLISGRNPELLIGQHVIAAPMIRRLGLEAISTGYMLVDCGKPTTASYISGTLPIPYDKPEIAGVTAMAGEMLGNKIIYLDGGSGASRPISSGMIGATRKCVNIPIVVGGGIQTEEAAHRAWTAGADFLVMGTAIEENPDLLFDICAAKKAFS